MVSDWVAGEWVPKLVTSLGVVPVDTAVAGHIVTPTISSVSPNVLNPAGGETVTVFGSGFPASLDTEDSVVVYFSDNTACRVQSCQATEVSCIPDTFNVARRRMLRDLADISLIVEVNSQQE